MSTVNMEKLEGYIKMVIDQACDAQNYMGDRPKFWFMVIGDDLLFDMEVLNPTKYAGDYIVKRTLYRLYKNVRKNFDLQVYFPRLHYYDLHMYNDLYQFSDPKIGFDWRRALTEVISVEKKWVLCSKFDVINPDDLSNELDDQLKSHIDFLNFTFKDVFKAYAEVFNESPLGIWRYYREHGSLEGLNSKEFIEGTAREDLTNHKCNYYSVCMYACDECHSRDDCMRPYDKVMRDGIAKQRWLNLKRELLNAQAIEYLWL